MGEIARIHYDIMKIAINRTYNCFNKGGATNGQDEGN